MVRTGFFVLIMQLFYWSGGQAQTTVPDNQADTGVEDFAQMLPPLQALIDSALIHSPALRMADNDILLSRYELKETKRSLLDYIYLQGNTSYGTEYYLTSNEVLIDVPQTRDDKIRYSGGLTLRMPLSEIFDRKIPAQKARIGIEQAESQKEIQENNIAQLVITAYYDLLSQHKSFTLQTELLASATMAFEQAKIDYGSDKIALTDYLKISESFFTVRNAYELQKNNYNKALLLTERLIGTKIFK
jgi:outer membrane protein TolC